MFRTVVVAANERALVVRGATLVAVLRAGSHRLFDPRGRLQVARVPLADPVLAPALAFAASRADTALQEGELHAVQLGATEVGLRYAEGRLVEVLPPRARRVFLKTFGDARVVRVDVARRFVLPYSLTLELGTDAGRARVAGAEHVLAVQVPASCLALLFVDGARHAALQPGLHAFFRAGRDLRVEMVDLRRVALDPAGQTAAAGEKLALRLRLGAGERRLDAVATPAWQARTIEPVVPPSPHALRAQRTGAVSCAS